jgi:hypothetical protein
MKTCDECQKNLSEDEGRRIYKYIFCDLDCTKAFLDRGNAPSRAAELPQPQSGL